MLFSEIIGQQSIKKHLVDMHSEHRIPHAMLFQGIEGSGGLPLAIAFAQYINCSGDKSHGDSCGTCPSCLKYSKIIHPDLHCVFPIIRKKDGSGDSDTFIKEWRTMFAREPYFSLQQWLDELGGDKQGGIAKSDAVAIHKKLSMKAFEAKYQILILWQPELMNETAANRLLKILEEPPAGTMFILVSENASAILPTILSRTQVLNIPPIDDESMLGTLVARFGVNDEQAQRIAHIASGNFVKALQVISQTEETKQNLNIFTEIMRSCYSGNVPKMTAVCDDVQKLSRESVKNLLAYSQRMVRENFVMNLNTPKLNYMTPDEEAFSQRFSRFVHIDNVMEMSKIFNDAIAHVEQNGNVRIITMDLLLQLAVLLKKHRP